MIQYIFLAVSIYLIVNLLIFNFMINSKPIKLYFLVLANFMGLLTIPLMEKQFEKLKKRVKF
jgi:hypothetical protein